MIISTLRRMILKFKGKVVSQKSSEGDLRKTFIAFKDQCIWIQQLCNVHSSFDPGKYDFKKLDLDKIFQQSSPIFFDTISIVLQEYILLQVARILDPSGGKSQQNLGILHMNELLERRNLITNELKDLTSKIIKLGKPIKKARNKLIAHADKKTILKGTAIGGMSDQDWNDLTISIHAYTELVGKILGTVSDYKSIGLGPGDVSDLVNYIRAGIAFHGNRRSYFAEDFYNWAQEKNIGDKMFREYLNVKKSPN